MGCLGGSPCGDVVRFCLQACPALIQRRFRAPSIKSPGALSLSSLRPAVKTALQLQRPGGASLPDSFCGFARDHNGWAARRFIAGLYCAWQQPKLLRALSAGRSAPQPPSPPVGRAGFIRSAGFRIRPATHSAKSPQGLPPRQSARSVGKASPGSFDISRPVGVDPGRICAVLFRCSPFVPAVFCWCSVILVRRVSP